MEKSHPLGMEPQRWVPDSQRLRAAELHVGKISLVATHGKSQMPEMHANLVRASGQWPSFEQGCAIGEAPKHAKFSVRRQSVMQIRVVTGLFKTSQSGSIQDRPL